MVNIKGLERRDSGDATMGLGLRVSELALNGPRYKPQRALGGLLLKDPWGGGVRAKMPSKKKARTRKKRGNPALDVSPFGTDRNYHSDLNPNYSYRTFWGQTPDAARRLTLGTQLEGNL